MPARATEDLSKALIKSAKVAAGQIVTAGFPIKRVAGGFVQNCAADEASDGIALDDGTAGKAVSYVVNGSPAIVKAKVGATPVVAGTYVKMGAAGVIPVGVLGGGTVLKNVVGRAYDDGAAADEIGVVPLGFASVSA